MIDVLAAAGHPVKTCCRLLGVSSPGYYRYKHRPIAPRTMRREWLTGLIREVHTASRQTYGSRRVHAELTQPMGVQVSLFVVADQLADIRALLGVDSTARAIEIARAAGFLV